jgi:membrane protease YdiL (CAAX protease family)
MSPDAEALSPDVPSTAFGPYLLITFGLAWGVLVLYLLAPGGVTRALGEISARHPLFILAVYAPAIAAIAVVTRTTGFSGLRRFLSRLSLWRCSPYWYGFLLVGIGAIYVTGAWLKGTLFTAPWPFTGLGPLLAAMAFMLVLGPVEEIGWRGVALPILQRRFVPLVASLILGVVWGVWHLPAFFLSGTPQGAWGFTPFLIGAVATSVIVTPLFNASGGSVLLAALFHFQLNNPIWPDAQPHDTIVFIAAALAIVALNRTTMFSRASAVTRVVPVGPAGDATPEPASGPAPRADLETRTGSRVACGWVTLKRSTDDREQRSSRGVGWWRHTWFTAHRPDRSRESRCV